VGQPRFKAFVPVSQSKNPGHTFSQPVRPIPGTQGRVNHWANARGLVLENQNTTLLFFHVFNGRLAWWLERSLRVW